MRDNEGLLNSYTICLVINIYIYISLSTFNSRDLCHFCRTMTHFPEFFKLWEKCKYWSFQFITLDINVQGEGSLSAGRVFHLWLIAMKRELHPCEWVSNTPKRCMIKKNLSFKKSVLYFKILQKGRFLKWKTMNKTVHFKEWGQRFSFFLLADLFCLGRPCFLLRNNKNFPVICDISLSGVQKSD